MSRSGDHIGHSDHSDHSGHAGHAGHAGCRAVGPATARKPVWRSVARGLADLFLPRACAVCMDLLGPRTQGIVCSTCWVRCEHFPDPTCARCGHPRQPLPGLRLSAFTTADAPLRAPHAVDTNAREADAFAACRWCHRLPPTVRAVRSAARLDSGSGSAIVHALKYSGWAQTASGMAQRMARLSFPADVERERVALVPIPLSSARERERGFNQSLLLAEGVSKLWGIPVWSTVLRRDRETSTQTRLTPSERTSNVSGAFGTAVGVEQRLRGAHLVLVDDVITTAATMNAAAAALSAGGARILSYLTFGRAPDPGDRSSHVTDPD